MKCVEIKRRAQTFNKGDGAFSCLLFVFKASIMYRNKIDNEASRRLWRLLAKCRRRDVKLSAHRHLENRRCSPPHEAASTALQGGGEIVVRVSNSAALKNATLRSPVLFAKPSQGVASAIGIVALKRHSLIARPAIDLE